MPPVIAAYALDQATGGHVTNAVTGAAGDVKDALDPHMDPNSVQPYNFDPNSFSIGGSPQAAAALAGNMYDWGKHYGDQGQDLYNQAFTGGNQAQENPYLVDRFNQAGANQQDAMALARAAALGEAPSEAQYMMQQGLNNAVAGQQSQMASARGAAALANAQGNAAGNMAALQNQAAMQGGQLRAQEMANARGMFGGFANQYTQDQLARLGMANQMAMGNAQNANNYTMGMLGQAGNFAGLGQGYMGMGNTVATNQATNMGNVATGQATANANATNARNNIIAYNQGNDKQFLGNVFNTAGKVVGNATSNAGNGGGGGG